MSEKNGREILCNNCLHRDVCSHKSDYLAMVMALENTYNHFVPSQRDFMVLKDPGCMFFNIEYSKSLGIADLSNYYPTQRIIQEENERVLEKGRSKEWALE